MARKPIEHERVGLLTPRERIWRAARALRSFTITSLQDKTRPVVNYQTCASYVRWLHTAGHLAIDAVATKAQSVNSRFSEQTYTLVKDAFEAPRVGRKGEPVFQGLGTLAMWRAMKVLREFDWHDIQRAASTPEFKVSPNTAATYVRALARAGYFRELRAAKPGQAGRYRLVRDTGAHAPAITRRKTVFDRNTGEFPWQESAQEVCDALE